MSHLASFIDFLDAESASHPAMSLVQPANEPQFQQIAMGYDSVVWLAQNQSGIPSIFKQYMNIKGAPAQLSEDELRRYHEIQTGYAKYIQDRGSEGIMGECVEYLGKVVNRVAVSILELPSEDIFCRNALDQYRKRRLVSRLPYVAGETLSDWINRVHQVESEKSDLDDGYLPDTVRVEIAVKNALRNTGMPVWSTIRDIDGYPITHENVKILGATDDGELRVMVTDIGSKIRQVVEVEGGIKR